MKCLLFCGVVCVGIGVDMSSRGSSVGRNCIVMFLWG